MNIDDFELACGKVARIICGDAGNIVAEGMPAYAMDNIDSDLASYFGIHVGCWEAWLPVLIKDGYCDGDIWVFSIDLDAASDDGVDFYEMDDPHVVDLSESPSSNIVFSDLEVIPPQYVKLLRKMTFEQAREYYEEFSDYDEETDSWVHPFDQ